MNKLLSMIIIPVTLSGMSCEDAGIPVPQIEISKKAAFVAGAVAVSIGTVVAYRHTRGQLRLLHAQYAQLKRTVDEGFTANKDLHKQTRTAVEDLKAQELETRRELKAAVQHAEQTTIQQAMQTRSQLTERFNTLEEQIAHVPAQVVAELKKAN